MIGIDNVLKAMRDGYTPYMELIPPQIIQGCTWMKVTVSKKRDRVDLYLDVDGRFYMIPAPDYPEVMQTLRDFVRNLKLPEAGRYIGVRRVDGRAIQMDLRDLTPLLLGDSEQTKRSLKKHKPGSPEAVEETRNAFYEEMLEQRRVVELEWKCGKESFLTLVGRLRKGYRLVIREDGLHDAPGDIEGWYRELSTQQGDYYLAEFDIFSKTHGIFLFKKEHCDETVRLVEKLLLIVRIYGNGGGVQNV